MSRAFIATLFLALTFPAFGISADYSALTFADSLAAEGDHYRAITEYKRFLHRYPESQEVPLVRLAIARCLIAGQRWPEADQALIKVLETAPGTPEATTAAQLYADIAFERGAYSEARDRYLSLLEDRAEQEQATHNHARYRIGWTHLEEAQLADARRSFAQLAPERATALSGALDDFQQLPRKSPLLAGTLSAIVPGSGQLYTGRVRQAALAFALNAVFIYGALEAFENDNHAVGGILLFFETGWYTGNIYNAVNNAHKFNQRQEARFKGELRQRFGLHLGWEDERPLLLARLRF